MYNNSNVVIALNITCKIYKFNLYDCAPHALTVETIYSAICECQLLYPDPEQSDSSCEDEITGAECSEGDVQHIHQCPADFFTSADGLEHLTAEGETVLAHLESILHVEDQQDSGENGK
jgi:hypothetical protein